MHGLRTIFRDSLHRSSLLHQTSQLVRERKPGDAMRALHWMALGLVRDETTVSTEQGRFTVSTRDTAVGRDLFVHGCFEDALLKRAFRMMHEAGALPSPRADVLLDIGANVGITSIAAVKLGLVNRTVAVEPEPGNNRLLRLNVQDNGMSERITCVQAAVSAHDGTASLEISPTNLGDHRLREAKSNGAPGAFAESQRETVSVPSLALDTLVEKHLGSGKHGSVVLWVDVQGFENHVFEGGGRFLSAGVPTVMELWPYGMARADVSWTQLDETLTRNWSRVCDLEDASSGIQTLDYWRRSRHTSEQPGYFTNLLLLR